MTKFLLQTFAIAGAKAELDKWEGEFNFYSKQLDTPDIGEYNEKYCKEKRDEAIRNITTYKGFIKEIEEYEFQRHVQAVR